MNGRVLLVEGAGGAARFNTPSGLALDASGNLYVADTGNHAIRKISPAGQARFDTPCAIAVDAQGQVWIADAKVSSPMGNWVKASRWTA